MRSATRIALAAFALVLCSGSAAAQNDVTFQVDLQPYITSCQFDPATETAFVRGSFQSTPFNLENPLTAVGNGIYATTVSIPEGPITYKFYTGLTSDPNTPGLVGWEDGADRSYTVTAGAQTIPTATVNRPIVDSCTQVEYDLLFSVDMSIQQGRGAFDPATQRVGVVGEIQGWNTGAPFLLSLDSFTGQYSGVFQREVAPPSATGFKFIIINPDNSVFAWDAVNPAVTADNTGGGDPNRIIRLTGTETDADANGRPDFVYDNDTDPSTPVYFRDQTAADFLSGDATVTFNIDLRPAQYRLTDVGTLPQADGSPAGGNTTIESVFINGPAAGESNEDAGPAGGIGDWAAWGEPLRAQTTRQLTDADADGIYTVTLNYSAGATRNLVAKFGVNGADDEAGFGLNHNFPITTGANTYNVSFGCVRQADGSFVDQYTIGTVVNPYDEYLVVNNTVDPETCTVVRNGGTVAVENGPSIAGLALAAYPNPVRSEGTVSLTLDRAMAVTVRVYDVMGRTVATLAQGRALSAGTTTLGLDTAGLASGMYVLRVEADGQVASRRLTVTR